MAKMMYIVTDKLFVYFAAKIDEIIDFSKRMNKKQCFCHEYANYLNKTTTEFYTSRLALSIFNLLL